MHSSKIIYIAEIKCRACVTDDNKILEKGLKT